MCRNRLLSRTFCLATLSLLQIGSIGCSTLSFFRAKNQSDGPRPPLPSELVSQPTEKQAPKEKSTLTSVAEFLARTSEYQMRGSTTDNWNAPAKPTPVIRYRQPQPTQSPRSQPRAVTLARGRRRGPEGALIANTTTLLETSTDRDNTLILPVVEAVSVRPVATVRRPIERSAEETEKPRKANHPVSASGPEPKSDWTPDEILAQLQSRAKESPGLESLWPLKFVQLAFHRDSEASKMPPSLPAKTRDILSSLVSVVPAVRAVVRDSMTSGDSALSRVDELRGLLVERSDPHVSVVAMCRKVVTFGVYDEMEPGDFVAGRSIPTIVYSEIRNLRAEETDDGLFRTELGTRLEILTEDGQSVWQHEEPEIKDVCHSRRRDFFVAERITLPATLLPGDYVLKVLVEDKLSGRFDETALPFTLQPRLSSVGARYLLATESEGS